MMPPRYSVSSRVSVASAPASAHLSEAGIERLHDVGARVADVVEDLGEVGDDVGGAPAGGDDVVDAREVGRVLAQQLGGVVGQLDGVERGPALLPGPRRHASSCRGTGT